ncbi:glyoxylate/hydroxypyruvate reductase A [Xenophilus sp. AP218F]|nr:glyoxylate/hydroxypyruvate reductase A [Chromobacterium sp. ASV5]OWY40597.1 glyoxylate/hydroxypyruvate reductase A [Xenophilus sp. AP218F]
MPICRYPLALLTSDPELFAALGAEFKRQAPGLRIAGPDDPAACEARVAACWFPPQGSLGRLPRLALLHSTGAGIDHFSSDSSAPKLPACRVIDPEHRRGMIEYVRWTALHYQRDFDRALAQQTRRIWRRHPQRAAAEFRVGVMGLGSLGAAVALDLANAGYPVRGWSRSDKRLPGIECHAGDDAFPGFLAGLDLLVNLLPLTDATRGILNQRAFARLARGAAIVNCGRGPHLVTEDLALALHAGQLRGAALDVFEAEPLPSTHPLWSCPGVLLTPHMASAASYPVIVRQILDNARNLYLGLPLRGAVDWTRGY